MSTAGASSTTPTLTNTGAGANAGPHQQQQQPPAPPTDPMEMIAQAMQKLADLQVGASQNNTPRVRAINCRPYVMGQDFGTYIVYFEENTRSAHNYPPGDIRLDDAYCTWIGSKLEVGATLTAYNTLSTATKRNWPLLKSELSRLFMNEEEKQRFLSNPAAPGRKGRSLLEYRNEITRLVDLYQPDLKGVPSEYQRQLVDRFISGLEGADMQRKLRFYCRRDKLTLQHAYDYAVDYESTAVEEEVKEMAAIARYPQYNAVTPTEYPHMARPVSTPGILRPTSMDVFQKTVDPRVHSNTLAIEQLRAGQAKFPDSLDSHRKQFEENRREDRKFMEEKFGTLEFLLTASQATTTTDSAPQLSAIGPQATRPHYPRHF